MTAVSPASAHTIQTVRSRLTNRPLSLGGIDNRTRWARRRRDVLSALLSELGREPTQRDRALAGNVATIIVRTEQMAAQIASGEHTDDSELVRLSHITQRLLSALKAENAKPKASPGLGEYLAAKQSETDRLSQAVRKPRNRVSEKPNLPASNP